MTRLPLAALAGGLLWGAGPAPAQDGKQPAPVASTQTRTINELIAKGWEKAGIVVPPGQAGPTARATDLEFMRRAFVDLIGRIPTTEEIADFEADKAANKRAKLIARLLNNPLYEIKDKAGKPLTAVQGVKLTTRTAEDGKKGQKAQVGIDYNGAYAQNFAELWTTWMLTRSNVHPQYRRGFSAWLTSQFVTPTNPTDPRFKTHPDGTPWDEVVREIVGATGRTQSNNAVVFVLRHLGDPLVDADARRKGEKEDLARDGRYDAVPVTSRVTKLFLGIQSQCVQCHNHPFNKEYVQADFWGVNGFFRQTDRVGNVNVPVARDNQTGGFAIVPPVELRDEPGWNTAGINDSGLGRGMVRYERRDGQKGATVPTMLRDLAQFQNGDKLSGKSLPGGQVPSKFEGESRRQVLARWVTEHDNFARAFVNRVWGHLFGRGLNKEPTVDDFSSNNEVVHPELLDYLAAEFKAAEYDPKRLLEWVCNSDAYNLSHVANKAYAGPKFDPFFARMPLKALSPEVMFDSLAVATRAETRRSKEAYDRLRNEWTQKLTQNFGDDEGNEVTFNGTVIQALLMMNGREINGEVGSGKGGGGVVEEVVRRHRGFPAGVYDELFLMTVSRHPTKEEMARLEEVRAGKAWINLGAPPAPAPSSPGGTPPKGPNPAKPPPKAPANLVPVPGAGGPDDVTFYQDVFWALLNSGEFMLNH